MSISVAHNGHACATVVPGDVLEIDGNADARIIQLMPETPVSRFRLNDLARRRLAAMVKQTGYSEAQLVEIAITDLRAKLLHGEGVRMTIPEEPDDDPKSHKKAARVA
jgi:hypothetical protein